MRINGEKLITREIKFLMRINGEKLITREIKLPQIPLATNY
jgi:hypothetical protein